MRPSNDDYTQSGNPFQAAFTNPVIVSTQRRPNPYESQWKILVSEWPAGVHRVVENREPLRKVAGDYGVSYETIRRIVQASIDDRGEVGKQHAD